RKLDFTGKADVAFLLRNARRPGRHRDHQRGCAMRTVFRGFLLSLMALVVAVSWTSQARAERLADILSRGSVRIIVFADVPPFGSMNANRQLEGFDIDLANLVAEALGVRLEL